jgi:valyl-tRNA synthetase
MQTIRAVRNLRAQLRIPAGQHLAATIESNGMRSVVEEEKAVIGALARIDPLRVAETGEGDSILGVSLVVNPLVVRMPLEGIVDLTAEARRLGGELDAVVNNEQRVQKLLDNPNFVSKARPEVVENERQRLQTLGEQRRRLEEIIAQLGA